MANKRIMHRVCRSLLVGCCALALCACNVYTWHFENYRIESGIPPSTEVDSSGTPVYSLAGNRILASIVPQVSTVSKTPSGGKIHRSVGPYRVFIKVFDASNNRSFLVRLTHAEIVTSAGKRFDLIDQIESTISLRPVFSGCSHANVDCAPEDSAMLLYFAHDFQPLLDLDFDGGESLTLSVSLELTDGEATKTDAIAFEFRPVLDQGRDNVGFGGV